VHGYLSLVSAVCCHVEVFATGRSLFQRGATVCGVSECDFETSTMRGAPLVPLGLSSLEKEGKYFKFVLVPTGFTAALNIFSVS
jgi:hypothetical protein